MRNCIFHLMRIMFLTKIYCKKKHSYFSVTVFLVFVFSNDFDANLEEYKETQIEFNGQTRILCEEFKVVYKAIDVN